MRNHDREPCGDRSHEPEVARQTPYPLGYRPLKFNYKPICIYFVFDNKPLRETYIKTDGGK